MIDDLLKEIADLKKAKDLLERVWISFGPYKHRDVFSPELSRDLERFFKFDDSE